MGCFAQCGLRCIVRCPGQRARCEASGIGTSVEGEAHARDRRDRGEGRGAERVRNSKRCVPTSKMSPREFFAVRSRLQVRALPPRELDPRPAAATSAGSFCDPVAEMRGPSLYKAARGRGAVTATSPCLPAARPRSATPQQRVRAPFCDPPRRCAVRARRWPLTASTARGGGRSPDRDGSGAKLPACKSLAAGLPGSRLRRGSREIEDV